MSVHRGLVMPFVGLGLHFLVAIYFAVHALRSGQGLYWLFILFSFPILGSVVVASRVIIFPFVAGHSSWQES